METNGTSSNQCPNCGETVRPNWKICPICETRLIGAASVGFGSSRGAESSFRERLSDMELVFVSGGRFRMGDFLDEGLDNEKPVHPVELDGFYISRAPVTQAMWNRVMPENPSRFLGDNLPVEQVTWHQAGVFIEKLNRDHTGSGCFHLPTEAQWEYAARSGGKPERFSGSDVLDLVGWYLNNSGDRTHPVGEKAPNGLGLVDMSGNVWEWCRDGYREDAYVHHAPRNPLVEAGPNSDRVIRGGSFALDAWSARCSRRFCLAPDYFGYGLGFRVVFQPSVS